jgi:hypothetical protein
MTQWPLGFGSAHWRRSCRTLHRASVGGEGERTGRAVRRGPVPGILQAAETALRASLVLPWPATKLTHAKLRSNIMIISITYVVPAEGFEPPTP